MRKGIIIGIGTLIILLALAGTVSAHGVYGGTCTYCHTFSSPPFTANGNYFNNTHKFNGSAVPSDGTSCTHCHVSPPTTNLNLISNGSYYNDTHRYNGTILASQMLSPPACYNCHTDVNASDFSLLSGTPYYLTSSTCKACHKAKYDAWRGTNHANKLVNSTRAQEMLLPDPAVYTNNTYNWSNVSYVVTGLTSMYYVNETGYIFKKYNATNMSMDVYVPHTPGYYNYNCGRCHTTGYNSSGINALPGIVGTWYENGIGCERCHNKGGNGHQVQTNVSAYLCLQCHSQKWSLSKHAPPLNAETSCLQCHSPFDYYKNNVVNSTSAISVVCDACHNPHDITADGYGSLYSTGGFNATNMSLLAAEGGEKESFFNSTASYISRIAGLNASLTAGNDIYDDLASLLAPGYALLFPGNDSRKDNSSTGYGTAPINVTGPASEVLCSMCHYKHGLGHIANVSLSHARAYTSNQSKWATCTDCHMAGAGNKGNHSFNALDPVNFPTNTCSRGTECHVTSAQNQSASLYSIVPVNTEWKASAHNNAAWGAVNSQSSCAKCHSPKNWNPMNASDVIAPADYEGVSCMICHDTHDMGSWIKNTGKVYGWYKRDAINKTFYYKANYTTVANTTELCGNCHSNRPEYSTPGWDATIGNGPHNSIVPHTSTQKDLFTGSYKAATMNFECADCHMYINKTNGTGAPLNDSQKITGHNFTVNATGLQGAGVKGSSACSQCHYSGSAFDTVPNKIASINASTTAYWNSVNASVEAAWVTYNAYTGPKNLSGNYLAQAFYDLYQVKNDGSWGVHDPTETNLLLGNAATLANASIASLGQGLASTVNLTAGWNLVALNGTPAVTSPVSVMSSVSSNITVVWGYNTSSVTKWELYDPLMPSGLNSLKKMVPGQGYWIYAKVDTVWTV